MEAARLAGLLKELFPKVPIVLGGPFSVLGGEILQRWPQIDFVVQGEGEEAGIALLDGLFTGGHDLAAIAGLCRRTGGYHACASRQRFLPTSTGSSTCRPRSCPTASGVSDDNLAVLISSRGCPYRCAFCSSSVLWKNRLRHHAVPLLIDYLKDLRKTTGAIYFSLRDENFLANKRQVRDFTKRLGRENLHYLFNAQGSAALVDEESAARLAAAGCDQLQMGIETISPRLQAILQKKQSPGKIKQSIAKLRHQLIRPFGYFIYGMGETEKEAAENLEFIPTSGLLDAVASPLVHYPGTMLSASLPTASFFDNREILYYDESSRHQLQPRYEKALDALARKESFHGKELQNPDLSHLPATMAKFFHWLATGKETKAERLLLAMTAAQPDNPWGPKLLGDLYAERGEKKKAQEMRRQTKKLVGGG